MWNGDFLVPAYQDGTGKRPLNECHVVLVFVTLRASEAAAQCTVIAPVCVFVCLFVGLLPR